MTMKRPDFFARSELASVLWAFRREFMIVGIFSMIANVLMLTPTLYMLQVFDRIMVSQSELTLLTVSLVMMFLLAVMAFAEWSRSRLLIRSGVRLDGMLNTRIFNASFESYLSQSGASPARAFGDLTELRQFLTGQGIFALFDTPWTPIYIGVLFLMHPVLGFVAIGFALIQGALAWWGHRRTVEPALEALQAQGETTAYLQGKLRNAEALQSMGMVSNLRAHWHSRHQVYLARATTSQALALRIMAWSKFIRYSQQSLALALGALLVIQGELSPGAMIASNVLISRALAPIDMLVGSLRAYIGARAAYVRLETLLAAHPERDVGLMRVPPKGAVTLRDVVASAPGRDAPILKGINLEAEAGTVTVVLGPSGSGKSTLARVLMGIWPNVAGEVLLDERPLAGWDRMELGPHLGYLPQDIELFEGTIAENIARFSEVDSTKVIAAANGAGLHEMILRFPGGYDTPIGEAGNLLSGGQRQRIGLARAIYGNPSLVVLDEPNANLDDAGDAALLKTVRELKSAGKTVFLITHRPGAVAVADRVLFLRDGQVVAYGPTQVVLAALKAAQPAQSPSAPAGNPQPA
jgi:ATP-binding cassette subfamily C exporter for protease/lipase